MRVAVVGLGRAGSTLACLLADRGVEVVVLEQEPMAPLLDGVDHLLPASYRDVVVRTPYRLAAPHDGRAGAAVLVGDAAHAMSPQLGTGTSPARRTCAGTSGGPA